MVTKRRAACSIAASLAAATAISISSLGLAAENDWELITDERLLNPKPGDWLSYRRTYDVTGFSPLRQINRRNVGDLRPVWSYSVRDNSRWVATPIVANGLMYVLSGDAGFVGRPGNVLLAFAAE